MTALKERESNLADRNPYEGFNLPILVSKLESAQHEAKAAAKVVQQIEEAIEHRAREALDAAREAMGKEDGTIHAVVDGCDVTSTIPKRVEWDTDSLNELASKWAAEGEDVRHYIEFKLSMKESIYKALPPVKRKQVDACRTTKHGKEKIVVTEI